VTGTLPIAFSSGVNDLVLGIIAAVLVAFAIVVSMVVPRRRPEFPARSLAAFLAVSALLVIGMLTAVEALGESHDFGTHEEAAGTAETMPADTATQETGTTEETSTEGETTGETATETGAAAGGGNAAAGKSVFTSAGCSSCHTLEEAGATGNVGPNLDDVLQGKDASFIEESIVDPNAEVTQGYQPNVMPQNFGDQLSPTQLADLVAFLSSAASK